MNKLGVLALILCFIFTVGLRYLCFIKEPKEINWEEVDTHAYIMNGDDIVLSFPIGNGRNYYLEFRDIISLTAVDSRRILVQFATGDRDCYLRVKDPERVEADMLFLKTGIEE